jgi:cytidylate kinase
MSKLVIIRGYSGSGKTTVSKRIAKKYRWELINYDLFFFGVNIHEKKLKSDYEICFETVKDCLKNIIKKKRDVVLEGALAPIDKNDLYNTDEIVRIAKRHKYKTHRILLIDKEKVSYSRMRKRHNVVKKVSYKALKKKILEEHPKNELIIDTSDLTVQQVQNKIEKFINPKKD